MRGLDVAPVEPPLAPAPRELAPGCRTRAIVGRRGSGASNVDAEAVAVRQTAITLPMIPQWDERFDIGADTLTW